MLNSITFSLPSGKLMKSLLWKDMEPASSSMGELRLQHLQGLGTCSRGGFTLNGEMSVERSRISTHFQSKILLCQPFVMGPWDISPASWGLRQKHLKQSCLNQRWDCALALDSINVDEANQNGIHYKIDEWNRLLLTVNIQQYLPSGNLHSYWKRPLKDPEFSQ